jgi:hypothetical protein
MKLFLLIVLSHFDTLPAAETLHKSLDAACARSAAAALAEHDAEAPRRWMNYVPSVGTGYNLQGQIRPTLSFSFSQVFGDLRQRRELKAKRQSITATAAIDCDERHRKLTEFLTKRELLLLELLTMRKVAEIDEAIFRLAQADYDAAKIAPKEFLPKQRSYLQAQLDLTRKETELRNLEAEITSFAAF